jgi:hypothetical protein
MGATRTVFNPIMELSLCDPGFFINLTLEKKT